MPQKSDKPQVRNLIIGCVIAILIFHFAWPQQYITNLGNMFFLAVDFILLIVFGVQSASAYKYAEESTKEWKRVVIVCLAVLSSAWAAGWSAGLNERVGL